MSHSESQCHCDCSKDWKDYSTCCHASGIDVCHIESALTKYSRKLEGKDWVGVAFDQDKSINDLELTRKSRELDKGL